MKTIEQKIITESGGSYASECFEKRVNRHLGEGWVLVPTSIRAETKFVSDWMNGSNSHVTLVALLERSISAE